MKHSIKARLKWFEVKLDCLLEAYTREEERLKKRVESLVSTLTEERTRDFHGHNRSIVEKAMSAAS